MELVVDLSTAAVALEGRDDMERFSVLVVPGQQGDGALGAVAGALSVQDAGVVGPDGDVLVTVAAVKRLADEAARAEGRPLASEWERGFASMLEYADTRGWITDGAIRAHIEWAG
jgi:hypothetical protein